MYARLADLVDGLRRPEYTGQNRCTPCTVANLAIAGVATLATAPVSPPLALVVLAASLASITLRGYLIPGTPELTRRYFPDRVLALFDKAPRVAGDGSFDPGAYLVRVGLVRDDPAAADVALDPAFETAWTDRLAAATATVDEETGVGELAGLIGVGRERLAVDRVGTSAVAAYVDDSFVGQWESRAAFVADMTAARALDARDPAWRRLPLADRSALLAALRLFLERCPACDGPVALGDEVVTSCCRSRHVVAATCGDCGDRLLEVDVDPATLADGAPRTGDADAAPAPAGDADEPSLVVTEYDPVAGDRRRRA
jgi:hypothetical protein